MSTLVCINITDGLDEKLVVGGEAGESSEIFALCIKGVVRLRTVREFVFRLDKGDRDG